jgi:hypothetical protein
LLARGPDGVKLVTSDAHSGLVDVAANAPAREGDLARFIERVRFFVTPENYTNVEDLARRIRRRLADGLREAPSWIAFAREKGTVSHMYTVTAPDPFVAPYYSFLLERRLKRPPDEARSGARASTPTDAGRACPR